MKSKEKALQIDEATLNLIKSTASDDPLVRTKAQWEMAKAIELPLREAILYGDVLNGIFETITWPENVQVEYPLGLIAPGEEDEFVAFTSPGVGYIPERRINGNYVTIPTYNIANSIDWELRFARTGVYNIIAKAMEILAAGFVKKINDDGMHTLIAAGVDRNIVVYDGDATAGVFTKRLVSLMKTVMLRNGGGNAASMGKGRLTDIFTSPEAIEDVRNWDIQQVDELTRREIYLATDDSERLTRIFGVNLHPMYELGVGAEYQLYFTGQMAGSLAASDEELVIGVDLSNRDSFIMPTTLPISIFADDNMHRRQEEGYYGWGGFGFGVLDNRRVILGSF